MVERTVFITRERLREAPEWSPVLVQGLITRLLGGNIPGALEISELLADDPHLGRLLHPKRHASFMLAMQGEMRQSERTVLDIDAVRKRTGWGGSILSVGWQLAGALHQANRGEAAAALAGLSTSLPKLETLELWPAVLWTRARLRLAAGDAAYGLLEFTSALEDTANYARARWWHERLQVCLADLTLAAGHPNDARALLQGLSDAPDAQLSRAHLALATGQLDQAARAVEPLSTAAETEPRHRIAAFLVLAVVEATGGNHRAAAEYGASAMRLAKLTGNWLPLKMLSTNVVDELRAVVPHELWHQPAAPAFTYATDSAGLTER